jgi:hypothetical protein
MTTANKVLKKYGREKDELLVYAITREAKRILEYGPARGGNEVELSSAAPILAAMILVHQGLGDEEINEE